ncbi:MAG: hypothetical protein ACOY30_10505 [Bacillota bacterium]
MKRRIKTTDIISKSRKTWAINPKTRVHDNNAGKNKKKDRQAARDEVKEYLD